MMCLDVFFFLCVRFASCFLSFLDLWCVNFLFPLGKFAAIIFFQMFLLLHFFHLQQLLPSHAGYCHVSFSSLSSPRVGLYNFYGCIFKIRAFSFVCQHLMSTSKQFFTSADTLCLVWDLDSRVFPSVTEPWAFTTSCMLAPKEIPVRSCSFPETACHCRFYDTQGSWWWQSFSQFCSTLSHRPCALRAPDPASDDSGSRVGASLPSHQYRFRLYQFRVLVVRFLFLSSVRQLLLPPQLRGNLT